MASKVLKLLLIIRLGVSWWAKHQRGANTSELLGKSDVKVVFHLVKISARAENSAWF